MGLLDDAIREHLELKRKHGAAEEDLARQEAEALGPARREVAPADMPLGSPAAVEAPERAAEPFAAPEEPLAPADAAAEDVPAIEEEAAPPAGEAVTENVPGAEAPPVEPPPVQEPPLEEPPVDVPGEPPAEEDPGFEDRAARAPDEPPLDPGRQRGSTPPHGFPEVVGDGDPPAGERDDVLEETPDFLQESPEHDRLWFEQKPPRDFDFD